LEQDVADARGREPIELNTHEPGLCAAA